VDLKHSGRLLGSVRLDSSSDGAASGCSCVWRSSSCDVAIVDSITAIIAIPESRLGTMEDGMETRSYEALS
jgi:hypothetical protein